MNTHESSNHKDPKIFLKGLAVIAVAVVISIFAGFTIDASYSDVQQYVVAFFPYEALMALLSVVLWFVFLKKDVPVYTNKPEGKIFKATLPLIIYALLVIAVTLFTSTTMDYRVLVYLLGTAFFVGIAEEMYFRVAGFGSLLASGSTPKKAIILSAVIFSLFHLTNLAGGLSVTGILPQLINTFLMGTVFAYIYYKSESIWLVMLSHFLWDFASFTNSFGTLTTSSIFGAGTLVLSIIYFIWALRHTLKLSNE